VSRALSRTSLILADAQRRTSPRGAHRSTPVPATVTRVESLELAGWLFVILFALRGLQIVPLRVVLPSTAVAMGKHSKKDDDEPNGGRPGPADHGREGGMATRENAPELTEPDRED
jgi:hypothetical protein